MTKEQKVELVNQLAEDFKAHPNFYIVDMGPMPAVDTNKFRRACFNANLKVQTAKNSMIKKALERQESDYSEVFPHLKEFSTIIFVDEQANLPAKTIKDFRGTKELPKLKLAYIEQTLYTGNDSLEDLVKIKSKNDLIADLVALLQSPMKTVLGQLNSGGNTIMGVLETLSQKPE